MSEAHTLRVGVIFGGRSSEHEVSLSSAGNVIDALQKAGHTVVPIGITPQGRWLTAGDPMRRLADSTAHNGAGKPDGSAPSADLAPADPPLETDRWALLPRAAQGGQLPAIDVIFPVLHGPFGEDGTVQGLLEMANIPYVGCGVLSSAVGMDKAIAKQIFAAEGIRQTPAHVVQRAAWRRAADTVMADVESRLAYPFFVKPANMGSSVGVSKACSRAELRQAVDVACRYDRKIIVEQAVPYAREIEVSVLGNDEAIASVPGEIVPGSEFYDYAAKYIDDSSRLLIPAPLSAQHTQQVQEIAVRAFRALDGSGLARVDFLLDDHSGELYLNELNTMPGFTRISMYPKLWEASGISYPELVDRLIRLALERFDDKQQNQTTH